MYALLFLPALFNTANSKILLQLIGAGTKFDLFHLRPCPETISENILAENLVIVTYQTESDRPRKCAQISNGLIRTLPCTQIAATTIGDGLYLK